VPNAGQHDPAVRFTVRGADHTLFFTDRGIVFSAGVPEDETVIRSVVRLGFAGAAAHPTIRGFSLQPGVINYFRGGDPDRWHANLPTYEGLAYEGLYPGIDLVYRGAAGVLKSEFIVAPGADPAAIVLRYSGVKDLRLRADGALALETALGELIERAPVVYQQAGNGIEPVAGSYVRLGARRIGFRLGAYDRQRPLIIDPTIEFASYLGGSEGHDYAEAVALDDEGAIYVTGQTYSDDFPTVDPIPGFEQQGGAIDVFVTKLVRVGGRYEYAYSTYLGGSDRQIGYGIVPDGDGNAWVTGRTYSTDFPTTTNAIQPALADTSSNSDAFLTHIISASGAYTLDFSTYLGGYHQDIAEGAALDPSGDVWLVGMTLSSDFPTTTNAIQPVVTGTANLHPEAFVVKVDTADYSLAYASFLGGSMDEWGRAIGLDGAGNVYVAGTAWSTDFPTTANAFDRSMPPYGKGFLTKISQAGGVYTYGYSTLVGSNNGNDELYGLAVDSAGNAYVTGNTNGVWSLVRPLQASKGSFYDAFVVRIGQVGGTPVLSYSTYLGGADDDRGYDIACDDAGNVYVTGDTLSTNFPRVNPLQNSRSGAADAFVAKIVDPGAGTPYLEYSTYLGGTGYDAGLGIALGADGSATVAGRTQGGFPLRDPVDDTIGGLYDAFVCTIGELADLALAKQVTPAGAVGRGVPLTYTLAFSNAGSGPVGQIVVFDILPVTLTQVAYADAGAIITRTGAATPTWHVAELAPGQGGVITITGIVSPAVTGLFTLTNSATIVSSQGWWVDDRPDNNVATVSTVVRADAPATPTLVSPANGAVISDTTPLLAWVASAGATGYLLDWHGAMSDVGDAISTTAPLLADGTYTWTVAAYDDVGNVSAFAVPWSLTVDATAPAPPVLVSPVDGSATADTTPTLVWLPSGTAVGYLLDWNGGIVDVGATAAHTVTPALTEGVYTWTVAAYDALRNTSPFTDVWSFTVGESIAGLTAASSSPTRQGEPTAFTATVSAGSSVSYQWRFGDGAAGSGATPAHTYGSAGNYTAVVTASNALNEQVATAPVAVYDVLELAPVGGFTSSDGVLSLAASPALTQTLTLTYTPAISPTAGFGEFMFGGVGFTLQAVDELGQPVSALSPPLTLTVRYDGAELPPGMDEGTMDVHRYDVGASRWVTLTTLARYPLSDTLVAALDHLSEFALLGQERQAVYLPVVFRP
jgi:uncharacterized repeat protein (TIGR01451 family)